MTDLTHLLGRPVAGAGTHALVIGVGHYPDAKPTRGVKKELRTVQDLPSAADSAKLMCDWLLRNKDNLAAPLASLEVVIADPPDPKDRYTWVNAAPVDVANSANVMAAGERWFAALTAKPGETAFFYACGHGAGLSAQPVVFLSDLNTRKANPWAHHNVGMTAASLRHDADVNAAFFFADTCREFIPKFELAKAQDDSRFVEPPDAFGGGRDKVSLLCAASEALLAYEGGVKGETAKFGRFTRTLIKGLDGASARLLGNFWSVHPSGLFEDMKLLHRAYWPEWSAEPFEPSHVLTQNDIMPLVKPAAPLVPTLVLTDPEEAMVQFELGICQRDNGDKPWINAREQPSREAWLSHVAGGEYPLYAVAAKNPDCYKRLFVPDGPKLHVKVSII